MVKIPSPYREELHTALCAIKAGQRLEGTGICRSVRAALGEAFTYENDIESAMTHLTEAMEAWPESIGDKYCPVGGEAEYIKESICGTIWQNPRRLALLDYLIEQTA